MKSLPYSATARDLLEHVAGDDHKFHTVTSKTHDKHNALVYFMCSCGDVFEIAATSANKSALRNVQESP